MSGYQKLSNPTKLEVTAIVQPISGEGHLDVLCEQLMDYICKGHFEVYEKLLFQRKRLARDKIELIKTIYQNIESSTDQALSFNDKYTCDNKYMVAEEKALLYDLDALNRALTIRFVLEEQLVEIACN